MPRGRARSRRAAQGATGGRILRRLQGTPLPTGLHRPSGVRVDPLTRATGRRGDPEGLGLDAQPEGGEDLRGRHADPRPAFVACHPGDVP